MDKTCNGHLSLTYIHCIAIFFRNEQVFGIVALLIVRDHLRLDRRFQILKSSLNSSITRSVPLLKRKSLYKYQLIYDLFA